MSSVEALAAPAHYVTHIPVDDLHEAEHNRDLGDLEGLASSIGKVGVLQPVLVRSRPGAGYEIVDGARRTAAARLAGLTTVPSIIDNERWAEDDDVELARIIANVQRLDPSPLEEATAYERMISHFKMTGEQVAEAVGRSPAHVSKRRSLLVLPDEAKDALADHRINIQIALGMTGLARDRGRLDKVIDALPTADASDQHLERQRQELERRLAAELGAAELDRKRTARIAELTEAGHTIVDYPPYGQWSTTKYRVRRTGDDMHAVAVDPNGEAVWLTTEPLPDAQRHVPKRPAPGTDIGIVEQARRKKEAEIAKSSTARVAIVRNILSDGADLDEIVAYTLGEFIDCSIGNGNLAYNMNALVAELLGLDDNTNTAILAYAGTDGSPQVRVAAACVMAGPETALRDPNAYRWSHPEAKDRHRQLVLDDVDDADVVRYLGLLERHGYELTPEELTAITPTVDA